MASACLEMLCTLLAFGMACSTSSTLFAVQNTQHIECFLDVFISLNKRSVKLFVGQTKRGRERERERARERKRERERER